MMKKEHWQEWLRRELSRDYAAPPSEEFYRGAWKRIGVAKKESSIPGFDNPLVSIGRACWRAVPVLSGLLLLIAFYAWYYPPDLGGQTAPSAETYILDAEPTQSNSDLLYQIMNPSEAAELEAEP